MNRVQDNQNTVIEVKNLSKHFRLPTEKSSGIKQSFINFTKGIKGYKKQEVLHDISFSVEKGDFFGIVGRNGSGKSTLLKLISGIYIPNEGSISINGSLVSFIELGVGFNHDLTGRENVFMNGALMGFDTSEIEDMYDEIVEFAELGEFMDQKLKNYSSGMQVRLAFSCAIRAKSDILVLDEILAVGDEAFQRKCNDYFDKVRKDKKQTVVLVTHSMPDVRKYCNKAMMIHNGEVIIYGSPEDVASEYSLQNLKTGSSSVEFSAIKNLSAKLLSSKQVNQNDEVVVRVSYQTCEPIESFIIVTLNDIKRGAPICDSLSSIKKSSVGVTITHTVTFNLKEINDTDFRVNVQVRNKDKSVLGFIPEESSPLFIFKRTDYDTSKELSTSWGVLLDKATWTD